MNDQNLVNKPVKVEQIIAALRCIESDGLAGCCDCETCPFPEEAKLSNSTSIEHCNSNGILRAAADRLANDQTHIAALQKEIERLRNGRRWIPVTERLPEKWIDAETKELVNYLIFSPDFGVDVGSYHAGAKRWFCVCLPANVTHWMPLPEPPEVEK